MFTIRDGSGLMATDFAVGLLVVSVPVAQLVAVSAVAGEDKY